MLRAQPRCPRFVESHACHLRLANLCPALRHTGVPRDVVEKDNGTASQMRFDLPEITHCCRPVMVAVDKHIFERTAIVHALLQHLVERARNRRDVAAEIEAREGLLRQSPSRRRALDRDQATFAV